MSSVSVSGRWLQHNDASARLPAKPSKSGAAANIPLKRFRPILQTTFPTNVNAKRQNGTTSFFLQSCWVPWGELVAFLSVHNQPIDPCWKLALALAFQRGPSHFQKVRIENMKIDMACKANAVEDLGVAAIVLQVLQAGFYFYSLLLFIYTWEEPNLGHNIF